MPAMMLITGISGFLAALSVIGIKETYVKWK
jgi:maltose/moltooligosaccharide transporter